MIARLRYHFRSKSSKDSSPSSPPTSPGFGKMPNFKCVICFETYSSLEGFIVCKPFESGITSPREPHKLCIDCIRGHSHAAVEDMTLAPGGIGLRCPDPSCKNVLHFADFKFYLSPEVHGRLEKRMQHESVTSASLSDLVTCSSCSLQACVDDVYYFFTCECGRTQCRNCPRLYDEKHEGKACEELNEEENENNKMESKLSEIVVRVCHRCNVQYVKQDGCNKMTCRCSATQCYICREKDIHYEHFCDCETRQIHGKCPKCSKTCRLFENAEELDEQRMKQIQQGIEQVESHYEMIPIAPPAHGRMNEKNEGYYEILVDELCSKLALIESINDIEKDALTRLKDANRQELNQIRLRCQTFRAKADERVDEIKRILRSLET
jgi:TRIAD3 protein (E3 ubiquitin-protein ligase RNF216)